MSSNYFPTRPGVAPLKRDVLDLACRHCPLDGRLNGMS